MAGKHAANPSAATVAHNIGRGVKAMKSFLTKL